MVAPAHQPDNCRCWSVWFQSYDRRVEITGPMWTVPDDFDDGHTIRRDVNSAKGSTVFVGFGHLLEASQAHVYHGRWNSMVQGSLTPVSHRALSPVGPDR